MIHGYQQQIEGVWKRLEHVGTPKKTIRLVLDAFRDQLVWASQRDQRIHIPDIGVFYIARSKARRIAKFSRLSGDAKVKEFMELPESWRLAFRASKHQKGTGHGPTDRS